ncbi:MAG: hypothetical protein EOP81_15505 [Variovorax sp.]|nr:MAG: hypothetical protein EOP81_15505 [Variovorax sp.]
MILLKTEAGQQVLKDRSVRLSPRQRSAFILFDGKRSVDDVIAAGMGITGEDIDQMISLGLLGAVESSTSAAPPAAEPPVVAMAAAPAETARSSAPVVPSVLTEAEGMVGRSAQQRYQEAYLIATQLTANLGLRGFRLNLSVEGTSNFEELVALAPKIRAAVGPEKSAPLERALGI